MKVHCIAIDDCRIHEDADILCRNFESGLMVLKSIKCAHLILDHDLANMDEREKTGYDILTFLEDPENADLRPNDVYLCTDNASALQKMGSALRAMGYRSWSARVYTKEKNDE